MALTRRFSLRARLTAFAGVGALVVFATGALLLYRDLSSSLSTAITAELTVRVDDLGSRLANGTEVTASSAVLAQAIDADGKTLLPTGEDRLLTDHELLQATKGRIVVNRPVAGIGDNARLLARPLDTNADVIGVAATSTRALESARDRLARVLFATGPAVAAGVAAAVWLLAGAALRPVRRMAREASTISLTQTGRRLPQPSGRDEIAELGSTLNAMLTRIEDTIVHERAFIDDAAHELRTPLAVLRGELELTAREPGDEEAVVAGLASALEETDRLTRLTTDLLTLARADAGQLTPHPASTDLLGASRALAGHLPLREGVRIDVQGESTDAATDPDWFAQIVTNLVANANRCAATTIQLTAGTEAGHARLIVADDGPGFPPGLLPHVFDRFARGDQARGRADGGTGLGLAITASLVHAQAGTITADNGPPLGGAVVTVDLPLAPRPLASPTPQPGPTAW